MFSHSATIRVLAYLSAFAISLPAAAQGKRAMPASSASQSVQSHDSDRDHATERQRWFEAGRAVLGENPAELLNRAYRQKRAMLARQATLTSASQTQGFGSVQPLTGVAAQTWTSLGPQPSISDPTGLQSYGAVTGRVTSVVVDPKDSTGNTVYVGAAYGGVWRSSNAAASNPASVTFQPLTESQPTLAVGAIAVHPSENIVLVGTGEPNNSAFSYYGMGILRSTDGGTSWTLIRDAANHTLPFAGLGFSAIAFNTDNPSVVVAASAGTNGQLSGAEAPGTTRGLFYSTDKGLTWNAATLTGLSGDSGSATDVIYDPSHQRFFAVIRGHGYYQSTDGATWTRLDSQPTPDLAAANCGDGADFNTCPIYRGSLSVRADTGEIYTIFVDKDGNTSASGGIFRLTFSFGAPIWQVVQQADFDACGDTGGGCGTEQGVYNLYIRAVPNGARTDLYVGAVNIFKCTVDPTADNTCSSAGSWKDLTHVYGCSESGAFGLPGHVHPDQHEMGVSISSGHYYAFFGNDGGVNRTLQGAALNSSSCTAPNVFDNLNSALGSFSQFVDFSQDPSDANVILGGLQDNGSPARSAAGGFTWQSVNTGDGGYNVIDPATPSNWYTSNFGVTVQRCTVGASCLPSSFLPVVSEGDVGSDASGFYMPYLMDSGTVPQVSARLLAGTCRIWRLNNDGTGGVPLSDNFSTADSTTCLGDSFNGSTKIRALAAGGPMVNGNSQVIYAGMGTKLLPIAGHVFVTTQADAGAGTWVDRTGNINPGGFDVSDIYVDPHDASGATAYVTIMGFTGGGGHVWKTVNAGATWADISAGLPDAPANSVTVDPRSANQIYVGNDVGVFVSFNGGTSWTVLGAGLPSVPAVKLKTFIASGIAKLRVATYGRGLWQTDLPIAGVTLAPASLTFGTTVQGFATGEQSVVLSNIRNTPLTISSVTTTADFSVSGNSCVGVLPANNTCSVQVRFNPQGSGQRTGTLQIAADDSSTAHSVSLAGTGVSITLNLLRPQRPKRSGTDVVLSGVAVPVGLTLSTSDPVPSGLHVDLTCDAGPALQCALEQPSLEMTSNEKVTVWIWAKQGRRSQRLPASQSASQTTAMRLGNGSPIQQVTVTAHVGSLSRSEYLTVRVR